MLIRLFHYLISTGACGSALPNRRSVHYSRLTVHSVYLLCASGAICEWFSLFLFLRASPQRKPPLNLYLSKEQYWINSYWIANICGVKVISGCPNYCSPVAQPHDDTDVLITDKHATNLEMEPVQPLSGSSDPYTCNTCGEYFWVPRFCNYKDIYIWVSERRTLY